MLVTSSHFSPLCVSTCLLNPVLKVNTVFFRLRQASNVLFSFSSESWRDSADLSGSPRLSLQRSIRPCLRASRVIFSPERRAPLFLCLVFRGRCRSISKSWRGTKNLLRHVGNFRTVFACWLSRWTVLLWAVNNRLMNLIYDVNTVNHSQMMCRHSLLSLSHNSLTAETRNCLRMLL